MTKRSRPVHGPRPIAALVPVVARAAFARAAPAVAQMIEAWPAVVGPAIAAVTAPRRLAQGTLTIGCAGPVAMELQHLSTELIDRINRYLGSQRIDRLRFIQTPTRTLPARPRPVSSQAASEAAAQTVSGLPDGALRSALIDLGRAVLTESPSRLGKQPRTRC